MAKNRRHLDSFGPTVVLANFSLRSVYSALNLCWVSSCPHGLGCRSSCSWYSPGNVPSARQRSWLRRRRLDGILFDGVVFNLWDCAFSVSLSLRCPAGTLWRRVILARYPFWPWAWYALPFKSISLRHTEYKQARRVKQETLQSVASAQPALTAQSSTAVYCPRPRSRW